MELFVGNIVDALTYRYQFRGIVFSFLFKNHC